MPENVEGYVEQLMEHLVWLLDQELYNRYAQQKFLAELTEALARLAAEYGVAG